MYRWDWFQRLAEQRAVERPAVNMTPQRVRFAVVHDERVAIEQTRDAERQRKCPHEMIRPGTRIDEGVDDRDHAEHRQRRQSSGKSEEEQNRDRQLLDHRHLCGDLRGQQRDLILVSEEQQRELRRVVFDQVGLEEHRSDADADPELEDRLRKRCQPMACAVQRRQSSRFVRDRVRCCVHGVPPGRWTSAAVTRPSVIRAASA